MGCWSESCVVSGMEIPAGEPLYVAMMRPNKYGEDRWDISIPPIKGTYDDYGGIDLTESNEQFGLRAGENWRPVGDDRGSPVYIDASILEWLPALKPEFPYHRGKKVKTLGDKRDLHVAEIRAAVEKARGERFRSFALSEAFGYSDHIVLDAQLYVDQQLEAGRADFAEFLDFYGRAFVLKCAEIELRKLLVPGTRGPQHGGEQALVPFCRKVVELTRERVKRRGW